LDYKVRVLDEDSGTDATTRVLITSGDNRELWGTVGVSENIIEASWEALAASIEYGLSYRGCQDDRPLDTNGRTPHGR
jgi:2-isopropylmalate synthase